MLVGKPGIYLLRAEIAAAAAAAAAKMMTTVSTLSMRLTFKRAIRTRQRNLTSVTAPSQTWAATVSRSKSLADEPTYF